MELIQQVNTDSTVLTNNPGLLTLFTPVPWLLPKRYSGLPYSNLSSRDLSVVAAARAKPKGSYSKAISVAFFSKGMIRMLENCIYTMVKFGGVDNYIVATWSESDLEACLDLNLPCADASNYLPKLKNQNTTAEASNLSSNPGAEEVEQRKTQNVPEFESKAYNRIMWLKPAVIAFLIDQNYAVHSTDVDVSYSSKPVWESYLMYLNVAPGSEAVDAAFQVEGDGEKGSPINSGNFVALPTPGTKKLFSSWLSLASEKVEQGGNQRGLQTLFKDGTFVLCSTPQECQDAMKKREELRQHIANNNSTLSPPPRTELPAQQLSSPPAIIRTYTPPWWSSQQNFCVLSGQVRLPELDPCSSEFMYLHPVCTPAGDRVGLKTRVLDHSKLWFVDSKFGCPTEYSELQNVAEYYQKIKEKEEKFGVVPEFENKVDGVDEIVLVRRSRKRQHRRLFFVADEKPSVEGETHVSLSSNASVEQRGVGPASEAVLKVMQPKEEKEDTGFDENEDLSIYSGKNSHALERCLPLEVRKPGTEARVARCPLRLAWV
jgi:hypothetical protein